MSSKFSWSNFTTEQWLELAPKDWEQLGGTAPVPPTTSPCGCQTGVYLPVVLGTAGGCRSFLERQAIMPADRCPMPRYAPAASRVHQLPLAPPLPLPPLQKYLNGIPPPDRGQTLDWPYPVEPTEG